MKKSDFLLLLTMFCYSQITLAKEPTTPSICSTVTYQAFDEPPKTVKDCYDSRTEMFFINATFNGYRLPTLGVGLNIPSWVHESGKGQRKTFVGQVTKASEGYTVKVQIVLDGKNVIASAQVPLDGAKEVTVDGNKINLMLNKQKL